MTWSAERWEELYNEVEAEKEDFRSCLYDLIKFIFTHRVLVNEENESLDKFVAIEERAWKLLKFDPKKEAQDTL